MLLLGRTGGNGRREGTEGPWNGVMEELLNMNGKWKSLKFQDGYVSHVGLRRIVLETPELERELGATLTR